MKGWGWSQWTEWDGCFFFIMSRFFYICYLFSTDFFCLFQVRFLSPPSLPVQLQDAVQVKTRRPFVTFKGKSWHSYDWNFSGSAMESALARSIVWEHVFIVKHVINKALIQLEQIPLLVKFTCRLPRWTDAHPSRPSLCPPPPIPWAPPPTAPYLIRVEKILGNFSLSKID